MRMTLSLIGSAKLQQQLKKAVPSMTRAIGAGLYTEGWNIMTDAKRRTPVDLGALRASGYVTLPVVQGNTVTVELGFGGPAKEYAIVQHEHTEFNHPDGGEAKFLERAVDARAGRFSRNVASFTLAAFERHEEARKQGPETPDEGGPES